MSHKDGTLTVNGQNYQIVTLDYETYYDKEYTLSSKTMNTSEYIRDSRFHAHGVGIKIGNGKTLWYTGVNIGLALKQIDWTKSAMLAHNAPFDGFIASQIYDVIPAFYLDTLSMARAVHGHHTRHDLDTIAKAHGLKGKVKRAALADTKGKLELTPAESAALGGYCVNDTDDTYEIFWKMYDQIPDDELELIDMTCRMFCDPVLKVDGPRAEAELHKEIGSKAAAMLVSGADVSSLLSNPKFAELLKAAGYNPPMKVSPATGKLTYAFAKTDEGFKELARSANPKVAALCEARLKVKSTIGETRAVRLIEAGKDGMSLPVLLNYSGAHTHRWSGSNKMNMQNFKRGGELRKSIIAPDGHVIVVADSAQIEARVLAWLAGQLDLLEAFRQKRDVYSDFGSKLYGRQIDRKRVAKNDKGEFLNEDGDVVTSYEEGFKPDAVAGFISKICVLALGYSMGHIKLRATLKSGAAGPSVEMSENECKRIVNTYRAVNSEISSLWKKMDGVIAAMLTGAVGELGPLTYGKGYIQLPNGLFLQYYGLHGNAEIRRSDLVVNEASYLTRNGRSKIYGGLLTENVVQALARIIIGEQMLAIQKLGYRIVMMSHDEIVAVCPESQGETCLADMLKIMSTPPSWALDLPLAAEGNFDVMYSK